MMDISIKRIGAYILDIVFVFLITTTLINLKFLNPRLDSYGDNYEEYTKLIEDYNNKKIEDKEYNEKKIELNYNLSKDSVISSSITIIVYLAYFGLFQYFNQGQTLGKKVFKLQVVSNKDKKLNLGNYLIRMIILNNIIFQTLLIGGVYIFNKTIYYDYSSIISFLESVMETIILVMVILRKDNRGLHDIVAQTKVISLVKEEKEITEPAQEKTKSKKAKSKKNSTTK